MLTDPGGLQTFLNASTNWDCYETFSIDGTVYSTRGTPPVRRGTLRSALGDEIATCSFTILTGAGSAAQASALAGDWAGAPLIVTRVFVGGASIVRFKGVVSDVRVSTEEVEITGKSLLVELAKKVPTRMFGTLCPYVRGDADCGANSGACQHTWPTCTSTSSPKTFGGFATIPPEK